MKEKDKKKYKRISRDAMPEDQTTKEQTVEELEAELKKLEQLDKIEDIKAKINAKRGEQIARKFDQDHKILGILGKAAKAAGEMAAGMVMSDEEVARLRKQQLKKKPKGKNNNYA